MRGPGIEQKAKRRGLDDPGVTLTCTATAEPPIGKLAQASSRSRALTCFAPERRRHKISSHSGVAPVAKVGDKTAISTLSSAGRTPSNPITPMPLKNSELLDELAAGLDAGWDTPFPTEAAAIEGPPSRGRLSVAPSENPEALEAVDADWDAVSQPEQDGKSRARAQPPARPGSGPLRLSKRERREAERKRQAHQAQRKAANKQQRKADRQVEARRASDLLRAQRRAEAEVRASRAAPPVAKAPKVRATEPKPKRAAKPASAQLSPNPPRAVAQSKAAPAPVVLDRGAKKLIPLIAIALAVGVSLGFALIRAH